MRIALLFLLLLAACKKPNPSCERAVKHVFHLTVHPQPGLKPPGAQEQMAIDSIQKAALERCNQEGLSDAQRDCILGAKALDDRAFLMCPALVAKPPTWIIAPIGHPELLDPKTSPTDEPIDDQK